MVKRDKNIRVGRDFINLTDVLRRELEPIHRRRISTREITNGLANFMQDENLTPIIVRRARRKKRGLF